MENNYLPTMSNKKNSTLFNFFICLSDSSKTRWKPIPIGKPITSVHRTSCESPCWYHGQTSFFSKEKSKILIPNLRKQLSD